MASSLKNLTIDDTGYISVASGTSNQRPTVIFGNVGSGQSWTCPPNVTSIAVLVVAGGGGGGSGTAGGGGGAGGVVYNSSYTVIPGNSYSITVGAGGQGSNSNSTQATNGSNSVFDSLTATGGGYGGNESAVAGQRIGNSGGSGGGGSYNGAGGSGTVGQGNAGGTGISGGSRWSGGGGGGAGAVGQAGQAYYGGNGGNGVAYSITGITAYYGGGGAGGVQSVGGGTVYKGNGGAGGGGDSTADQSGSQTAIGYNGANNTGGGGGGGGESAASIAGNGGSGVVIISWKEPEEGFIRYNTTNKKLETFTGTRNTGNTLKGWTTDGLVFLLDAGDRRSYPGYGNIFYDLSGNNRHFTINSSQATWVSAGTSSYFNLAGTGFGPFNTYSFYGPPCDTLDFGQEHYIEAVTYVNSGQSNWLYHFSCTPKNYPYTSSRLACHFVYGGNNTYYDVHGCCDINSRIVYSNSDRDFVGAVRHAGFRTRTDQLPYRQVFKNGVSVVDSQGGGVADTAIWNRKDPAVLCGGVPGRLYYFAMYNRALTDTERLANFAVLQSRYGL
jgi:hypothetical protein